MSKSLGNGIDPLEVVEPYGADALRYTIVAGTGVGRRRLHELRGPRGDVRAGPQLREQALERRPLRAHEPGTTSRCEPIEEIADRRWSWRDRWILSRLSSRRPARSRGTWRRSGSHDAAGVALPLLLGRAGGLVPRAGEAALPGDAGASREAAQATLVEVLDGVFRLLHPIMPFVSEALWLRLPVPAGRRSGRSRWSWRSGRSRGRSGRMRRPRRSMAALMELIGDVRALRAEYQRPAGRRRSRSGSQRCPPGCARRSRPKRAALRARSAGRARDRVRATARRGRGRRERGAARRSGALPPARRDHRPGTGAGAARKELERMERLLRSTEAKLSNEQFVAPRARGGRRAGAREGRELPGPARQARGEAGCTGRDASQGPPDFWPRWLGCRVRATVRADGRRGHGRSASRVDVAPRPFSIATDHRGAVVIRFGDRVSERNLADAVRVSPETGEVTGSKRGRELRVSTRGRLATRPVYRIVVRPVLQDLYGNLMEEPSM